MKFNGAVCLLVVAACYYMLMATSSACPCSTSITNGTKNTNISGVKNVTDPETHKNRRKDVMQLLKMTLKIVKKLFKRIKRKAVREEKNCKDYSIIGHVDSHNINRTFEQLVNLTIHTRDLFHVKDLNLTPLLCNYELTMVNPVTCPVTTFRQMAQAALLGLDESEKDDYKFWSLCDIKNLGEGMRRTLTKLAATKAPKDKPENAKGKPSDKLGRNGGKSKRKGLGKKGKRPNRTNV